MSTQRQKNIPYGRQSIDEDDIAAVVQALRSPLLTQGEIVPAFESKIAATSGAKHAVAVSSGTAALHVACLATGIGPGDELLTSAITFVASSNAGLYCGSNVRFADISLTDYNVDLGSLERSINKNTKVVIPVHMAGQSCDMKAISEIVRKASEKFGHKIYIIEDASHALGGKYAGGMVGNCTYSDMTVYSLHPVKSITSGEGGVITTNNTALYESMCMYRSHGITKDPKKMQKVDGPWYYEQQYLGFNYRITDFQCALASSQLGKLSKFVERRNQIAKQYGTAFSGNEYITIPSQSKDVYNAYHLYLIRIDFDKIGKSRTQVMNQLSESGVGTQVHYIPVYRQPYYKSRFGFSESDFPNAEAYYKTCLSIPIFPNMTDDEVKKVSETIIGVCKK